MSAAEMRALESCPPELLPDRDGWVCSCYCDCNLIYHHPGPCARVSLSGLVVDLKDHEPTFDDWDAL